MKQAVTILLGFYLLLSASSILAVTSSQQIAILQKQMRQQQRQLTRQKQQINLLASKQPASQPHVHMRVTKTKAKWVAIPQTHLILGDSKANVSFSGQLSAMSFYANDGKLGYIFYGNNDVDNSRLSFDSAMQPASQRLENRQSHSIWF